MKLTNKEFIKNIEKKYTFEKNPSVAVAVSAGAATIRARTAGRPRGARRRPDRAATAPRRL